jgi:hypothetical protein
MFERIEGHDAWLVASWNDLAVGAPTLIALANLCSRAMLNPPVTPAELTPEAQAILYAARERGILEVKGNNTAYESPSRLLTVFVELADGTQIRFRDRDPRQNVRFLEGFRQLCVGALVIHHLYHEFSLSSAGFECAGAIEPAGIQNLLDLGRPCGPE